MTFPSIYFRHNSTDYAPMPYSPDSCFKDIALHFDETLNSLVIWRDSTEKEGLTLQRIKKLKTSLKKYIRGQKIEIYSMGDEQKISRQTIDRTKDNTKRAYLLSLNSVFDISKTRISKKVKYTNHVMRPRISCWSCWIHGFHLGTRWKLKKIEKRKNSRDKS